MEEKLGQSTAVLFKYEKIDFWLKKKPHPLVDVASLLRPFYVLRSSALVAVRRRAFFIVRKEVA